MDKDKTIDNALYIYTYPILPFPIESGTQSAISLPVRSMLLRIEGHNGWLCAWCLVDPDDVLTEQVERHIIFEVYGTEEPIEDTGKLQYHTTVIDNNVAYHVFRRQ